MAAELDLRQLMFSTMKDGKTVELRVFESDQYALDEFLG